MQEEDINKQLIVKRQQVEEIDTKKQVQCLVFCKKQQKHVYQTIEYLKNEVLEHQDTLSAAFLFACDKLNDTSDLRQTIIDVTQYAMRDIQELFEIINSGGSVTVDNFPDILDRASRYYRGVQQQFKDAQAGYHALKDDYQNQLNLVENLVVQKKKKIQSNDQEQGEI